MNDFDQRVRESTGGNLESAGISTIQVNVGLKCNQQCVHCHVAASPKRKEMMGWEIMKLIIGVAKKTDWNSIQIFTDLSRPLTG
jgi:MoaA/NifB/PqqE/SkfB family radical SAM enzyme